MLTSLPVNSNWKVAGHVSEGHIIRDFLAHLPRKAKPTRTKVFIMTISLANNKAAFTYRYKTPAKTERAKAFD